MKAKLLAITTTLLLGFCLFSANLDLYAQEGHEQEHSQAVSEVHQDSHSTEAHGETHGEAVEEEFNPSTFALDHIKDSHEWHILTKKNGEHVSVPLLVIVYSKNSGLHAFSSKKIAHGHSHEGFQMGHGYNDACK